MTEKDKLIIPTAGADIGKNKEWFLTTKSTPERSYLIEIVHDKNQQHLIIENPKTALDYLQKHLEETQ